MSIFSDVAYGDLAAVQAAYAEGASLDDVDAAGRTLLMVAAESNLAGEEMIRWLLDHGAAVNGLGRPAAMPVVDDEVRDTLEEMGIDTSIYDPPTEEAPVDSVLGHAVKHASIEKIRVLLGAGADVTYVDSAGYGILTNAMFRPSFEPIDDHCSILRLLLEAGAPRDCESNYGESPLSVASRRGAFAAVRLLLDAGADPGRLGWSPLHHAVVSGSFDETLQLLDGQADLEQQDAWERTPLLLAIHAGQRQIAELLLERGADRTARGRCGRPAAMFPLESDNAEMLEWLIDRNWDLEEADDFGNDAALEAAQLGAAKCLQVLLAAGVRVDGGSPRHVGASDDDDGDPDEDAGSTPIQEASTPEVARMLLAAGEDYSDTTPEMRQMLLGHEGPAGLEEHWRFPVDEESYLGNRGRRFGRSNPDRMNNPLWDAQVRARTTAYQAAARFGEAEWGSEPGWCFRRFGHSMTRLPDGRFVEIAGEHEDYYDPDFCIYNDVVVHQEDGTFDLYGYPESVFPPTDFHSATLKWPYIYVIGNLGYADNRRLGETPVYRLHCETWAMERVRCSGAAPGWINRHKARLRDDNKIEVWGGKVANSSSGELVANTSRYLLDLSSHRWLVGDVP